MPFSYSIDVNRKVIFFRGEGVVTKDELLSTVRAMFSDPLFHPDLRFFGDMTAIGDRRFSYVDVWAAAGVGRFSANARRAFLLKGSLWLRLFRVMKTSVSFHGKGSPRGFYSRTKALAWLNKGVPPEQVIP